MFRMSTSFTQHPFIATILWFYGKSGDDTKETVTSSTPRSPVKSNNQGATDNVTWKDYQGGDLNEYISTMNMSITESSDRELNVSQLGYDRNHSAEYSRKSQGDSDDLSTPPYGFYIPITPPTAEKYPIRSK